MFTFGVYRYYWSYFGRVVSCWPLRMSHPFDVAVSQMPANTGFAADPSEPVTRFGVGTVPEKTPKSGWPVLLSSYAYLKSRTTTVTRLQFAVAEFWMTPASAPSPMIAGPSAYPPNSV